VYIRWSHRAEVEKICMRRLLFIWTVYEKVASQVLNRRTYSAHVERLA